jgi:hypothetical protein
MKSFSQYITEEPIIDDHVVSKRYVHAEGPTLLGKIGRYDIHHFQHDRESSTVFITHNGKTIGNVPLGHYKTKVVPEGPSINPTHRGKKAKVKNLMPKVYTMIADKLRKTIESDSTQTKGSASVWARIAKMRKLKIAHRRGLNIVNHPVAGVVDAQDYNYHRSDHNFNLKRVNKSKRLLAQAIAKNDRAAIRDLKSDIEWYGKTVDKHRKKYGLKPGERMPKASKGSRVSLNGQTYVPSRHGKLVYHPEIGRKFTLRLEPKSRKRSINAIKTAAKKQGVATPTLGNFPAHSSRSTITDTQWTPRGEAAQHAVRSAFHTGPNARNIVGKASGTKPDVHSFERDIRVKGGSRYTPKQTTTSFGGKTTTKMSGSYPSWNDSGADWLGQTVGGSKMTTNAGGGGATPSVLGSQLAVGGMMGVAAIAGRMAQRNNNRRRK